MKFICPLLLSGTCFSANAQLKQGDWNFGTSTNAPFNLQLKKNNAGLRSYDFSFHPQFGYMLKDRWEIGGGPVFGFNGSRFKDGSGNTIWQNNSQSVGASLFTRYYFKSSGKLIPYLVAGIQYTHEKGSTIDINSTKYNYSQNLWQLKAGGGLNWFVAPRTALFTELTYTGDWGTGNGYLNGLNLQLGIRFYFGKKKK